MYESTFLSAVTAFEGFLEDLFFSTLLDKSGIQNAGPAVKFRSMAEARDILFGEQRTGYLDWLPIAKTLERSDRYLKGGRPFSRLRYQGADKGVVGSAYVTRNLIAHDSDSARQRFQRAAAGNRTASAFLRQSVGSSSRHQDLTGGLLRIGLAITAPTEKRAGRLLLNEDQFVSGQPAPRGRFSCTQCGTVLRHQKTTQPLDACGVCPSLACPHCGQGHGKTKYRRIRP